MNRRVRGQGLLEFALVMPILLFLLMGVFDFSRVLITYAVATNSLRTGLRLAEVLGYQESSGSVPQYANCAGMRTAINKTFYAGTPTISIQYVAFDGRTTSNWAADVPLSKPPGIQFCDGIDHIPNVNDLENGDMLQVRVSTTVQLITPIISNIVPNLPINLRGQRTIVNFIELTDRIGDSDYDGLSDAWENTWFGSTSPTGTDDPDLDGCNNGCEETRGTNPTLADTDADCLIDGTEIYVWNTNPSVKDTDGDGLWDGREANDTLTNPANPCGLYTGTNPLSGDSDGDGLRDSDELVGIPSPKSIPPNIIYHSNPLLVDSDGDTLSDYDEIYQYGSDPSTADPCTTSLTDPNCDQDRDGLVRSVELTWGTDPTKDDTDLDGVKDGVEGNAAAALNACVPDPNNGFCDADGDGLTRAQEIALGTNPNDPDSDGDGAGDLVDSAPMDPCSPSSTVCAGTDHDHDGTLDANEPPNGWNDACIPNATAGPCDQDKDGVVNSAEPDVPAQTNACVPSVTAGPCDRDGDGLTNAQELSGYTDPTLPDTDSDGIGDLSETNLYVGSGLTCPNPHIADSDSDGWKDGEEITNGTDYCMFDSPATISIADASITEGNSGTSNMVFTVSLSRANPIPITMNYSTTGGTASAGVDFADTSGVLSIPANQASATITVPIIGDTLDEAAQETFTLTLSNPNVGTFTRSMATGTINDNDPPPVISVSASPNPVLENVGGGLVTLTISLDTASGLPVSVNYSTANGTATAGTDYTTTSGSATIPAGQTSVMVPVPILNNAPQRYEGSEQFTFTLSSPINATLGTNLATVTITDDESMPVISASASPNPVSEGAGFVTVNLTLSGASDLVTTVNYATANGTAVAGSDYTATSNTATIAAGQLTTSFNVPITDDTTAEPSEQFNVNLSSPANATIATPSVTITINASDTPYLRIADATATEPTSNPSTITLRFPVTLFTPPGSTVTVSASVTGGSATRGTCKSNLKNEDYSGASPQTLTFPVGTTLQYVDFTVCADDQASEGAETVLVTLSSPSGAIIDVGTATGTIINTP